MKSRFIDKELAKQASKKLHELGKAHKWTSEDAKAAANKRWQKYKEEKNNILSKENERTKTN